MDHNYIGRNHMGDVCVCVCVRVRVCVCVYSYICLDRFTQTSRSCSGFGALEVLWLSSCLLALYNYGL